MAIILRDIDVTLNHHRCLSGVNLEFQNNEHWAVLGPNGGGKTTLLKVIMGLLPPTSGKVLWQNLRLSEVAYLGQTASVDVSQPFTVYEFVALGLWPEIGAFKGLQSAEYTRLHKVLAETHLQELSGYPLSALSGGQLQRALIARMLLRRAKFYILDEPFNAVDATTKNFLLTFIDTLKEKGLGLILVTHDKKLVEAKLPRVVILDQSVRFAGGTESVDFASFSRREAYAAL